MTGKIVKVDPEDPEYAEEYSFAHNGLFSRHPAMDTWPAGTTKVKLECHTFDYVTLRVQSIFLSIIADFRLM